MSIETSFNKYDLQFEVEFDLDPYPDLSWIGEYTNTYQSGAIDRKTKGDHSWGEYRYFVPQYTFADRLKDLRKYHLSERTARIAASKQLLDDYKRYEDFNNGLWYMQGVIVTAYTPSGKEIDKESLWGIESDCSNEYLQETIDDLVSEIINGLEDQAERLERHASEVRMFANKVKEGK